MSKKPSEQQILADIRRAYVLARALNIQYQFIREYVNPDLYKAISSITRAAITINTIMVFDISSIYSLFTPKAHRILYSNLLW